LLQRIYLQGTTDGVRHVVIEAVREAITDAGGWIVDFHLFTDLALSLIIELEPAWLGSLMARFEMIGIRLTDASQDTLKNLSLDSGRGELKILFNLTFQNGDGEQRLPVPAIPG
jgi:hypothetical protein